MTNWPQTQKCVFCKTTHGFVLVFVLFYIYIFNKCSCRNCGGCFLLQEIWLPRTSAQNTRRHSVSPTLSGSRTFGKSCTGQTGAEHNYQVKHTFYPRGHLSKCPQTDLKIFTFSPKKPLWIQTSCKRTVKGQFYEAFPLQNEQGKL